MASVTSADGTAIDYEIHGAGALLIFVPGALQHRAVDPQSPRLTAMLADSFRAVIYDRRGRGKSEMGGPYAVAREIEDIEALIDAEGGPAMLFGLSSGAVLALEAAAALQGKVTKVIAYEPPIDMSQSRADALAELEVMEKFKSAGDGAGALETFMRGVGASDDDIAGLRASPFGDGFAAAGQTLAHDYRIMFEGTKDMKTGWQALGQPVLIVDGDKSWDFMNAGANAAASALPNAARQTLPGQTHEVAPEAIAPVIRRFFSQETAR